MAEMSAPPPPPPPPLPPLAPLGCGKRRNKKRGNKSNAQAPIWLTKSDPDLPKSFIPTPPVSGFQPYYGAGAHMVGAGPSKGYNHSPFCLPPQPQVAMDVFQDPVRFLGITRRGTGVFHPAPQPRNSTHNNNNNIGRRNAEGAEVTYQTRRSESTSEGNDSSDKEDVSDEHDLCAKLGLPLEWTY